MPVFKSLGLLALTNAVAALNLQAAEVSYTVSGSNKRFYLKEWTNPPKYGKAIKWCHDSGREMATLSLE